MNEWIRVTRADPCGICGKPDWCTIHPKLGRCCMRVKSGKELHNGGWLHSFGDQRPALPERKPDQRIEIDATAIMITFIKGTNPEVVERLAERLGVTAMALRLLGCAWAERYHAWAFPMFNGNRQCIGIRLRDDHGKKWAVKGSRQGLFIPKSHPPGPALICEGPTDTAAAISLGYFAIGRPSCNGCIVETQRCLRNNHINRAVVVSDTDGVGIESAQFFADNLGVQTCFIVPMAKDLRGFVKIGATKELIDSWIKMSVWIQPRKEAIEHCLLPGTFGTSDLKTCRA